MNKIINFSIDDCIEIFRDITINNYNSLFESDYFSFFKELHDKYDAKISLYSFVEYKGSAKIESRKQFVFGGIPTSYTEYVISFEQDGKEVELVTKKRPDLIGDVDEIFIVYAKHSEFVIDFDIIQ